jgi:hypothetical protein
MERIVVFSAAQRILPGTAKLIPRMKENKRANLVNKGLTVIIKPRKLKKRIWTSLQQTGPLFIMLIKERILINGRKIAFFIQYCSKKLLKGNRFGFLEDLELLGKAVETLDEGMYS